MNPESRAILERHPEAADRLRGLARPVMKLSKTGAPVTATRSHIGGSPFIPTGERWPLDVNDRPLVFLAQINFADMPTLPGFPTEGMIQWFAEDGHHNPTFGLHQPGQPEPDTRALIRWWAPADLRRHGVYGPADTPPVRHRWPLNDLRPHGVGFTPGFDVPSLHAVRMFDEYADLRDLYEELADEGVYDPSSGDKIGGYPHLGKDTRITSALEDLVCLIQLDTFGDFTAWPEDAAGHVLGDPATIATGDPSSAVWSWG